MKKVLITGATGFIGHYCLPSLLARGYEVHAVSSKATAETRSNVHWHQVDLLDSSQITQLMKRVKPTHLLHFAWFSVPRDYWTSLENFRWVQASLDLFRAFETQGGRRVVVAGSCAEYDWRYGHCSERLTPLAPKTLYGACKHSLRLMLETFAVQTKLEIAWGRIFFLYGPREHPNRLVSSVICSLLKEMPALCSKGTQIRDFLYIKDAAESFVALLESSVLGAINIASGRATPLRDVICKIAEKIGREDLLRLGALLFHENEPHLLVADVSRLTHELNWKPMYDLDSGLDLTIAWWKEQLVKEQHGSTK